LTATRDGLEPATCKVEAKAVPVKGGLLPYTL
jgi:hypothetical protein